LLDSKREAVLRELIQRVRRRNELRVSVSRALDEAVRRKSWLATTQAERRR